jgi:pimeloyl-ACP methyl ester carboxylesterase
VSLVVLPGCATTGPDTATATSPRDTAGRTPVHRLRVGADTVAWYERGQGSPLLMLMGTGSTMAEWDPALLRLLARRHRLIFMDYVGIGSSSPLRVRHLTFARVADQVDRFLAARDLSQVDVLGWSMGGFVAQQLASRHPARVHRLVLAGTNPGGSHAVLGPSDEQKTDSSTNASDAEVLRELYPRTRAGQAEGRRFLRRLDEASSSGEIPDDFHVNARTTRMQVAAEDPWLRSNANWLALARLGMPVLATGGSRDIVVPPVNLRRIAARVPAGQLQILPGSHAFLFSARVRFVRRVDEFLAG